MRLSPDGGGAEEEPPRDLGDGKPRGHHGHDLALTRGRGADLRIGRQRALRPGRELFDHPPGPAGREQGLARCRRPHRPEQLGGFGVLGSGTAQLWRTGSR